jgi:hypothetical protein
VAIRALFTRIIATDVTTLNNHDAASREAFLSPLLADDILNYSFQSTNWIFHWSAPQVQKRAQFYLYGK